MVEFIWLLALTGKGDFVKIYILALVLFLGIMTTFMTTFAFLATKPQIAQPDCTSITVVTEVVACAADRMCSVVITDLSQDPPKDGPGVMVLPIPGETVRYKGYATVSGTVKRIYESCVLKLDLD